MATDTEKALEEKARGNAAFQSGDFLLAVEHFSKAIGFNPTDKVLYSNRSGAYASLKKFEEALKDAEKCVELDPTWAKGYSRKGLAEYSLGRMAEAESTYTRGLSIDPSNEALRQGLEQVKKNGDSMREMQAVIAAARAVRSHPKLGKYAEEDPEYASKLISIIMEIQKDPNNLKVVMAQPDVRIREGVTVALGGTIEEEPEPPKPAAPKASAAPEAKAPVKELTEAQQKAEAAKERGNALYKKRQFQEALAAYDEAFALDPTNLLYLNNKAAVYMEMGDSAKCIEQCDEALGKRYDVKADYEVVAKIYNRMAACYQRQKDYTNAISCLEKSLCEANTRQTRALLAEVKRLKDHAERESYINPEKAEEHRLKGNELFKNNQFPDAKKGLVFSRQPQRVGGQNFPRPQPQDRQSLCQAAKSFLKLSLEMAGVTLRPWYPLSSEYDEAIRRNPKDAKLYSNRAATLTKLFEYPSALKDCEMAISLDPTFVKGWSRKGTLHFLMKEYSKALEAFEKGLAVDPGNKECLEGRANVVYKVKQQQQSGEVDEEQMRHAMADPEIQQIIRDPQMSIVLSNVQENPALLKDYLKDPKIANGINKLIAAGILRVA